MQGTLLLVSPGLFPDPMHGMGRGLGAMLLERNW
jgi:hypothetical protein